VLKLKPFEPNHENFAIAAYFHNLKFRFWTREASQIAEDYRLIRPDKYHEAFFAVDDDRQPVAYVALQDAYWLQEPHPTFIQIWSPPAMPRSHLLDLADQCEKMALDRGATKTQVEDVDILGELDFWSGRGYEVSLEGPVSRCDVSSVNYDQFAGQEEAFRQGGYEIISLQALEAEGDCREAVWRLKEKILDDVPHSEPRAPQTFERFCEIFPSPMVFPRESVFFARKDGQLVGMSGGERSRTDPSSFDTHLTGTLPEHRRRGVATTLKLHVVRWCRDNDVLTIDTGNEKDNPMYQLNVALGFRKFCTFTVLDKLWS